MQCYIYIFILKKKQTHYHHHQQQKKPTENTGLVFASNPIQEYTKKLQVFVFLCRMLQIRNRKENGEKSARGFKRS